MNRGDPGAAGPPRDPREERFRPMGEFLLGEVVAVAVLATIALLATGASATAAAGGVVGLLVAIPLVRVLWLVLRWARRGDRRFALVGTFVLLVAATAWWVSR